MKHYTYTFIATTVACIFVSVPVASAVVGVGATAGTEVETTVMPMRVNAGTEAGTEPKVMLTSEQMNALMEAQAGMEKKNGEREIEGVRMEGEGNMGALREEESERATGTLRAREVASEQGLEGIENAELHIDL